MKPEEWAGCMFLAFAALLVLVVLVGGLYMANGIIRDIEAVMPI